MGYIWVTKNSAFTVNYVQIIWPIRYSFPLITLSKVPLPSAAALLKFIEQVLQTNITAPHTSYGGLYTLPARKKLRGPLAFESNSSVLISLVWKRAGALMLTRSLGHVFGKRFAAQRYRCMGQSSSGQRKLTTGVQLFNLVEGCEQNAARFLNTFCASSVTK